MLPSLQMLMTIWNNHTDIIPNRLSCIEYILIVFIYMFFIRISTMFLNIICLITCLTAASASGRSPIDRLRLLCEKISVVLPSIPVCRTEAVTQETRENMIDRMFEFALGAESELPSFISILSRALSCGLSVSDIDS